MGSAIFTKNPSSDDGDGRFGNHSLAELIEVFNSEVGVQGWVSSRGTHLFNLAAEFRRRGIGEGTVLVGGSLSLDNRIRVNGSGEDVERVPLEA